MSSAAPAILVCGAGQLGSRYLQGLARCPMPLRIRVHDVRGEALVAAELRWKEASGAASGHEVTFDTSLASLPRSVEIAIVAATADARPLLVGEIADRAAVRYWVLEKLLAQNEAGLDLIRARVGPGAAWVNTPRRTMAWHGKIGAALSRGKAVTLEVSGGQWGLACNAVHFLDLLAWWTGESLQEVSTRRLDPAWFESKRQGFWEVTGTLEAAFSRGSRALLSAAQDASPLSMTVDDGSHRWTISEPGGVARRSDGMEIRGRMEYQSDMTAPLIASILTRGSCTLPGLEESIALHRALLGAMRAHWRESGHPGAAAVPIT
jgi:hypothetical protein